MLMFSTKFLILDCIDGIPFVQEIAENLRTNGHGAIHFDDRIKLSGFRENALCYMRAFDLLDMPPLEEGLRLVLLEGMSGHFPVIASNILVMLPPIRGTGGLTMSPSGVEILSAAS
jgi:hypothetical protein